MAGGADTPERPVRRIALVRPNHRLGNTLLLMPLVQELEAAFPEARIDLVTACGAAAALYARYPQVSAAQGFPSRSYRTPLRVLATLWRLRHTYYDLAIDPIPRSRAGRFLLQWVRARDRVGYRWGVPIRDRLITHLAESSLAPAHFALAPVYLLRAAYLDQDRSTPAQTIERRPMDLRLSDAERRAGEQRLGATLGAADWRSRPRLALFAHATGHKGFPPGWWHALIEQLRHRAPSLQLMEIIPEDRRARLTGLVPGVHTPDLRLLGATLAAASLVVLPDCGVMHLAEAAGARVLGLFRASDPVRYGSWRAGSESLWAAEVTPEEIAERIVAMVAEPSQAAIAGIERRGVT